MHYIYHLIDWLTTSVMGIMSLMNRLLILPSFFSLSLFDPKSLNHETFMFSFWNSLGTCRLTGGNFGWLFRTNLANNFGPWLSLSLRPRRIFRRSSLLERWNVNKRGSFLAYMVGWPSTSSCRCDHSELSRPSFSREGAKKSEGSLLESMIRAAAVLNLLSLIFFFSILLIGIIATYYIWSISSSCLELRPCIELQRWRWVVDGPVGWAQMDVSRLFGGKRLKLLILLYFLLYFSNLILQQKWALLYIFI